MQPYPDPIRTQLQVPQLRQPLQPFYLLYPVLHEIQIRQLHQMRDVLDVLDLVEAEVEARKVGQVVETLDVRDEVIVEVELREGRADVGRELDFRYLVLPEAYFLYIKKCSGQRMAQNQRRSFQQDGCGRSIYLDFRKSL